jgi:ABC-type glycerol-3-phosphate transport system substrate-binding protein
MKKVILMLVAVLLIVTPMVFAGGVEEKKASEGGADEPITITWASWALAEESLKPTYLSMINEFMRQNPTIKVETVAYPYSQYKDQIIISAAGGNAPDVVHVKEEWIPPLIDLDCLLPLNEFIDPAVRDDYFPSVLGGVTYDGEIMCAPWFNSPYAMFYNKTLMDKAGITDLPKNLSELFAAARKISALGNDANGNKIYGYLQPNSKKETGVGYNFFPIMWGYGGEFVDDQGNVTINTPENVEAFSVIHDIFVDKISPNGTDFKDARNLFAQGLIGFYYDIEMAKGAIALASAKGNEFEKEYGTMVIPEVNGPDGYGYMVQHHNVVMKSAKHQEAAVKLATFFAGPEVLKILFDAGMGKMPARESVLSLDFFMHPESPLSQAFINALNTARPLPTGNPNFILADEKIADALTLLASPNTDVKKTVANLDKQVKDLYGQK